MFDSSLFVFMGRMLDVFLRPVGVRKLATTLAHRHEQNKRTSPIRRKKRHKSHSMQRMRVDTTFLGSPCPVNSCNFPSFGTGGFNDRT